MASTILDRVTGISTSVAVKAPCRVATTAAITLSGEQTIDGVAVVTGDRVLVKNQSSSAANGIYVVDTTSWDRSEDLDAGDDIVDGTTVYVTDGTVNHDNWFVASLGAASPITIGTDTISWSQTYVSLTTVSDATESTAGIVELATIAETRTGTDTARAVHSDGLASFWQKGSDIASANTLVKPSDANLGGYHFITGTTTINALWSGEPAGIEYEFKFAGTLTLNHNATSFILPNNGSNITTAAGDVARFRSEGSNNWRCVGYTTANGRSLSSTGSLANLNILTKTANYTALTTDFGIIQFTTASTTLSLPTAVGNTGLWYTVANNATTGLVTIDPNSTETLDGQTTRKLSPGDRVTIISNGSNWITTQGYYSFDTGELNIATSTVVTTAHGLGKKPDRLRFYMRNKTTELGYAVGDEVELNPTGNIFNNSGATVSYDSTNITIAFSSGLPFIPNKGTGGAVSSITAANWKQLVRVEAQ